MAESGSSHRVLKKPGTKVCPKCQGEFRVESMICSKDSTLLMLAGKHDPNPEEPIVARYLDGSTLELFCKTFIGSGVIHEVYDAFSRSKANRYAIKVIHHEIPSQNEDREQSYSVYLRGSKHGLGLEHKNIVRTFALGHPEDQTQDFKRPFVVCEFLNGESLTDRLDTNHPSLAEALEIATAVCDALDYAFTKNKIVHGNLKSSNIFLDTIDGKMVVKIGDFGYGDSTFRQAATGWGLDVRERNTYNFAYTSPECALGRAITAASDIYSLGCILYECISGRPPFFGERTLVTLEEHVKVQPKPLSTVHVPEKVVALVMKALEKDPENRCQSAAEMKSAIQAVQAIL